MIKQFLLNQDGTVPDGTNVAFLEAQGIPLVMPTERWLPAEGMTLQERPPQQDADGVWRQQWIEVPAPVSEPEPEPELPPEG